MKNNLMVTVGLRTLEDCRVVNTTAGGAVVVCFGDVGFVIYDREIAAEAADLFLGARDMIDDIAQKQLDNAS